MLRIRKTKNNSVSIDFMHKGNLIKRDTVKLISEREVKLNNKYMEV